jgi:hypothetical protein
MMDNYSGSRGDGAARDLAFLLCLYLAVAGGFAFGLYELLQHTRYTNSGLAAYKPSAATLVIPGRACANAAGRAACAPWARPRCAAAAPHQRMDAVATLGRLRRAEANCARGRPVAAGRRAAQSGVKFRRPRNTSTSPAETSVRRASVLRNSRRSPAGPCRVVSARLLPVACRIWK